MTTGDDVETDTDPETEPSDNDDLDTDIGDQVEAEVVNATEDDLKITPYRPTTAKPSQTTMSGCRSGRTGCSKT